MKNFLNQQGRTWTFARHVFLWVVLCLNALTLHAKGGEEIRTGRISRVVDGDTVWVSSGDELLKVRITGIDAPEICQDGGPQSREHLRNRTLGKTVTLISRRKDDYGRLLARVELNGDDLGRWMVSQGHAWSYGYRNYAGPYSQEQTLARASRLGLFGPDEPENPRSFRKRHGSCFP
ncbi:MAG: thermonuclease family protein [Pseudomonadota bacterium]